MFVRGRVCVCLSVEGGDEECFRAHMCVCCRLHAGVCMCVDTGAQNGVVLVMKVAPYQDSASGNRRLARTIALTHTRRRGNARTSPTHTLTKRAWQ